MWNKSDDLRNGTIGSFKDVQDDALLISFEDIGIVKIKHETWIKRNHAGRTIGSVSKFPVIPAYALHVTNHKDLPYQLQ